MKLSEKGLGKIQKWQSTVALGFPMHPREIDFEPDDFEDCVVLTVEEAKAVNEAIEWLCSTLEDYERERDDSPALIEGWNQMNFLEHKIEQVEEKK